MNAFIVLSVLVSAAVAVPHNSRLIDNYGNYGQSEVRILSKSYDEPRIISSPVYARSYAQPELSYQSPVLSKGYAISEPAYGKAYTSGVSTQYSIRHDVPAGHRQSYAQPILTKSYAQPMIRSYAEPQLVRSYAEPQLIRSYAEPQLVRSYAEPKLVRSYAEPQLVRSYAEPILTRSYAEPMLTKAYAAPIAEPIRITKSLVNDYSMDTGYGYGKAY